MEKMDIFDFRDMFAHVRSVAIVGNSSSIRSWNNGEKIDSYDLVVRFNRAYTKGVEEHVGSRTDVLFSNYMNSLERSPSPSEILNPKCVVVLVRPKRTLDFTKLIEWIGDIPYAISLQPDIFGVSIGPRTRNFTLGTYALYTILSLFQLNKLFLTGFTMFGQTAGGGADYFLSKETVGSYHDLDTEAAVFAEVVRLFSGELHMTPEVESLVNRNTVKNLDRSLIKSTIYNAVSRQLLRLGFLLRRKSEPDSWLYRNYK